MSDIVERVSTAEEWAKDRKDKLIDFTLRHERIAVTYTGLSIIASKIFSYTLRTLSPSFNIIEACIDTLTYHIVPYTEDLGIIAFVEKGTENSLIRLLDSAYYTGNKVLLITPPLVRMIRSKVRGQELIEVNINDVLLSEIILASVAGYEIARRKIREDDKALRLNRLRIEVHDYSSIVYGLISSYRMQLNELRDLLDKVEIIGYTPTMEPVAYYMQSIILEKTRKLIPTIELTRTLSLVEDKKILDGIMVLFSTTVEEYSVRELLFKSIPFKIKVVDLKIKTDPLTAPVYGIILLTNID